MSTAVALCGLLSVDAPTAKAVGDSRSISLYNIHSKETLTVTYKKDGAFVPEAMKQISWMMRDWRRDEATSMDPELVDLVWQLHKELGSREPVHVISGYRSPKTNEGLRRRGGGQAKKSQHILGKAADIKFPDVPVKTLRNSALLHEVGGVGFYPKSGVPFVHVDTGNVRAWPRVPRQELAMLFPSGRTRHMPADGRPLTARDGQVAMAKLKAMGKTPFQYASLQAPRATVASLSETKVPSTATTTTVVASAGNALPWMASEDKPVKPVASRPQFAAAQMMPIPAAVPGRTAKAVQAAAKPAPVRLPFQYASADAEIAAVAAFEPRKAAVRAAVKAAPKSSDRLAYRPAAIEPLMSDISVSYGSALASLEHPTVKTGALLGDANRMQMPLKAGRAYSTTPPSRSFSGAAVKNLAHFTQPDAEQVSSLASPMTVASLDR